MFESALLCVFIATLGAAAAFIAPRGNGTAIKDIVIFGVCYEAVLQKVTLKRIGRTRTLTTAILQD